MEKWLSIFWPQGPDAFIGQVIITAILVLLALAIWSGISHRGRYRKEELEELRRFTRKLRQWNADHNAQDAADADESAPDAAEEARAGNDAASVQHMPVENLEELRQGIDPKSLIGDRLDAIIKLRRAHVKVSVDALQQMTQAKEDQRLGLRIPTFTIGIAMMLGMLGTFIGLALMIEDIAGHLPDPNDTQSDMLDEWLASITSIRGVLGGMQTAFSTTLVGLTCAIVAAGTSFVLRSAQAYYFEQLERFTIEELLPTVVPAMEDEDLLEKVSFQLEGAFSSLDGLLNKSMQTLQDLRGIQEAFINIVEQVRDVAQQSASGKVEGILGELTQISHSVVNVSSQMPAMLTAIRQTNQQFLDRVTALIQSNERTVKQVMSNEHPLLRRYLPAVQSVLMMILALCLVFFVIYLRSY